MVLRLYMNVVTSFLSLRKVNLNILKIGWEEALSVAWEWWGLKWVPRQWSCQLAPAALSGYSVSWKWRNYMAIWVMWCLVKHSRGHPKKTVWHKSKKEREGHSEGENMHQKRRGVSTWDKWRGPDCTCKVVPAENGLGDVYKTLRWAMSSRRWEKICTWLLWNPSEKVFFYGWYL